VRSDMFRYDRPGTGKTITMIEAMKQILRKYPNARVLACAPSNSAADILVSRLGSTLGPDEMFRFYAPSRSKAHMPIELLKYAHVRDDGSFSVPPMARMKRFRVIVTTCVSASVVAGIGLPRGHYSHVFIDEAGQATEPEAFVSIKTIAANTTNIVLSGDPKQLGPIIRSTVARVLGLEKSYLERLMEREVYDVERHHDTTWVMCYLRSVECVIVTYLFYLLASSSLSRTSGRTKLSSNSRMKGSTVAISRSAPILVLQTPTSALSSCLQGISPSYSMLSPEETNAKLTHLHSSTSMKRSRSSHTSRHCAPNGSSEPVGPCAHSVSPFP
jgi:hypothetical protein